MTHVICVTRSAPAIAAEHAPGAEIEGIEGIVEGIFRDAFACGKLQY